MSQTVEWKGGQCGGVVQVERRFKWVWADHGDDISRQYAGTGALKSGFTRTGQRTMGGLLDDGVKSAMRYFLNNFRDGRKQDALDLLTGTYTISKGAPTSFLSLWDQESRMIVLQCRMGRLVTHLCPKSSYTTVRIRGTR